MNRNSKILSVLAVAFAFALSMALVGCGQQASSSAASTSASAASASASAGSASASAEAGEVSYSLTIDATEADKGVLYDQNSTIAAGTTVYQALVETGLSLAVDSSSGSAYVSGIGDAIASDGKAGWLFTVNGETPEVGADQVVIADGDAIEWKYYADVAKAM